MVQSSLALGRAFEGHRLQETVGNPKGCSEPVSHYISKALPDKVKWAPEAQPVSNDGKAALLGKNESLETLLGESPFN